VIKLNNSEESNENDKLGTLTQKEIYEIPSILQNVLAQKDFIRNIAKELSKKSVTHIYLIGAGSSYHAGFAISYMFNRLTNIPTFTEYSMEFQYLILPILQKSDCVIGISQSGETKDTVESLRQAKEFGSFTIGITNNPDSNLAKVPDIVIELKCGEEKSVLATKTYLAELTVLVIFSLELAGQNKSISNEEYNRIWVELIRIPDKVHSILPSLHSMIKDNVSFFKSTKFCFIIGSGPDYATAMEAALKLKEGARIFSQAYSTAEFPHGPITLADSDSCILAIIPHEEDKRKENLLHLLKRLKERDAKILGIYESIDSDYVPESIDYGIKVPNSYIDLQPLIIIIAIQLLTIEIAKINGLNPDEPKFLTKISNL
jgi:glucosamine--fructose-6-phosphate aminotransferase (isomerizing)